jgi:hypothetical protein
MSFMSFMVKKVIKSFNHRVHRERRGNLTADFRDLLDWKKLHPHPTVALHVLHELHGEKDLC